MHESAQGEIYDFLFPYSNYFAIRNNFASIGRVYVFISGLEPGAEATACFGRLEALKETPLPIRNPSLTVNGDQVTFEHDTQVVSVNAYRTLRDAGTIEKVQADRLLITLRGEDRPRTI